MTKEEKEEFFRELEKDVERIFDESAKKMKKEKIIIPIKKNKYKSVGYIDKKFAKKNKELMELLKQCRKERKARIENYRKYFLFYGEDFDKQLKQYKQRKKLSKFI